MAIAKALYTEQIRKHAELYKKFVAAVARAGDMLAKHGMNSSEFTEADKAAGLIAEDIHRLIGRRHWTG
ncbi:hypothetical protein [Mesorhizobium marinum]|uniref:hypothetical protein n=1 Tax=Mesorhizobium marinum TaxID=3228790 RepID=UPI003465D683